MKNVHQNDWMITFRAFWFWWFYLSSLSNYFHNSMSLYNNGSERPLGDLPLGRASSCPFNFLLTEKIQIISSWQVAVTFWMSKPWAAQSDTCHNWSHVVLPRVSRKEEPLAWDTDAEIDGTGWPLQGTQPQAALLVPVVVPGCLLWCIFKCAFPTLFKWLRMRAASNPQGVYSESNRPFCHLIGLTFRTFSLKFPLATKCLFIFPLIFILNFQWALNLDFFWQ